MWLVLHAPQQGFGNEKAPGEKNPRCRGFSVKKSTIQITKNSPDLPRPGITGSEQ
jgi:hypothetical protein